MSEAVRRGLKDLRHGLLRLHKALLDSEQVTYERINGRVASSGQLLQLVMTDPWFAWLRPLSHLVVRIRASDDRAGHCEGPVGSARVAQAV
jgi:hypothetical protein